MYRHKKLFILLLGLIFIPMLGLGVPSALAADTELTPGTPWTFEGLNYADRTAYSMFGALEYYFPIPEDWVLQDGTRLGLVISHSPLLKTERSTMTVIVNGMAVHSVRLDETNQERATISVDLPTHIFQNDPDRAEGYVVQVQFFMHLTDLVCEETNNPALWATVHQESTLTLNAEMRPPADDLALLPYPLIVKNAPEPDGVTFSFAGSPSQENLEAALKVAAYLGRAATQGVLDFNVFQDGSTAADQPSIAVGYAPDGSQSSAPGTLALLYANDQAVLAFYGQSPMLAADVLLHPDLNQQISGQSVDIREFGLEAPNADLWPWKYGAATFWQLGAPEQKVHGVGQQSRYFFFQRPAGWDLTIDEIYLDLHLTPSPMLLMNQSGAKVRINGVDVGAISYADQPGEGGFYRLKLPADLLNITPEVEYTDALVVELVLEHQLQQEGCEPIYAENAWTTVHSNSYFYFPHTELKLPDLSLFPYPFLNPTDNDSLTIVVPSDPTDDEIAAALMVSQILGKQDFFPWRGITVRFADQLDSIVGNAILVGTPARNPWVRQAEEELPETQRGLVQTAVTQAGLYPNGTLQVE